MSRIIDIYLIYQFIRRLVTPFDQMEAFKQGIIDKDGKFLKKRRDLRTSAEKNALGYFDVLIINLKKLLGQFPGGRTRLATYAAALYLIRENTNKEHSEEMLIEGLERYMKEAEPYLSRASAHCFCWFWSDCRYRSRSGWRARSYESTTEKAQKKSSKYWSYYL
jgi:hypothetical protein